MKRTFLTLLMGLQIIFAIAQIPANYYNSATGLSGTPLRAALHDIIDGHSAKSYSSLLSYYQTTDKKPNNTVWDMYSDVPNGIPPYTFTFSQNCGNYSVEGDCWNREHSWPQSWFNSSSPMVSDLFHVYPTDGKVNGWRSNYPYGEVTSPTITTLNGGKLGPCSFPGYTGIAFEPINEYKGDFARTYFYMSTRYYTEDSGWQTNDMITGANLKPWAIELLKKWHQQDPVSAKEIARNNAVYGIQGNRNPFIDHPEYVCLIWAGGTYCSIIPSITNIVKNPSSPGVGVATFISATITDDGTIASANLNWGTSSSSLNNTLVMGGGANNVYTNSTAIPGQVNGTIVYFQITATDNAGNIANSTTQSYTVGTPPSPAPVITNILRNPNSPNPADAVTISATITDDASVSAAQLLWGTDGTTFPNTITMNAGSNNIYTASSSIPAQAANTIVYYKISANDNLAQNTTSATQQYTVTTASTSLCAVDLLFSEYLEGSSNNKYLEIYNGTGAPVNLSDYKVNLFSNGSTTSTQELLMSGTLNNGDVYVIKNSAATLYNGTATISNVTFFNGDDAVALTKISTGNYVDILGRIGEDPGTAWAVGNISMLNKTLIRKATILQGVSTNPASGFPTLGTEWNVDSIDVATNIGSHTMTCPSSTNTITTQTLSASNFCKGGIVNVSFQVTGSINTNNVYTAELSDVTGSFTNASSIGTLTSSNLSDIIPAVIPANASAGNAYRIRVKASAPQTIGSDNGTNLTITNLPTVNAGSDVSICLGKSVELKATGAVNYFWEHGADSSATIVIPTENTVYIVTGIDANGCSKTDSVTVTVKENPTPIITEQINSTILESNISVGNQWYINGNMIPGENNQTVDANIYKDGLYYTIVTNPNGCVSDTSNQINMILGSINKTNINQLKFYPNPTTGEFIIDTKSMLAGNYQLNVYNNMGQLIQSNTFNTLNNKINLGDAPSGLYQVVLRNGSFVFRGSVVVE